MALIEEYHLVADMYPIHAAPSAAEEIIEGMFVALESDGTAVTADGAVDWAIGVAGDSSENSTGHTQWTADMTIRGTADFTDPNNPDFVASHRATANRVSDFFDETLASGKITVYTGGGRFSTDQYVASEESDFDPSDKLYVGTGANVGLLTVTASTQKQVVGICVKAPSAYPSGVPGTDVEGSMSLGTYLSFQLVNFYWTA